MINLIKLPHVYLIEKIGEGKVEREIGIEPTIDEKEKTVTWRTSNREILVIFNRIIYSSLQEKIPLSFRVISGKNKYDFIYLTKELYEQFFRESAAFKPEFKDTAGLQTHYLKLEADL